MEKYLKANVRRLLLQVLSERAFCAVWDDLRLVFRKLKNAIFLSKVHVARRIQEASRPLYLNLGSGAKGLRDPRWINVDGYFEVNVDFCFDLRSSWPFPASCFDGIFTEHVLEHFTREEGLALLKECYRVLQPDGLIRIVVPDGQKIMRAYFDDPDELARHRGKGFACAMDRVNSYFRQSYEHQFIYDREMLCIQMKKVGFIEPHSTPFRCGEITDLLLDAEDYEWESLYLEARKPG